MGDNVEQHDLDQVWENLTDLQKGQAETRQEVAGLNAALNALINEVKHLASIVTRPQEKVNWIGIGSLVVAMLICGGSYTNSVIRPLKETGEQNHLALFKIVESMPNLYQEAGKQMAVNAHQAVDIADMKGRIHNIESKASESKADRLAIHEAVRDIDRYGSRRWVKTEQGERP